MVPLEMSPGCLSSIASALATNYKKRSHGLGVDIPQHPFILGFTLF